MTQVGNVYGQALYSLVKDERLDSVVLEELQVLKKSFSEEPGFVKLLAAAYRRPPGPPACGCA